MHGTNEQLRGRWSDRANWRSGWLFGLGQATLNLDPPQRRSREPGSASGGLTGMQGLCQEFSSRDYTPWTMITLLTEVR